MVHDQLGEGRRAVLGGALGQVDQDTLHGLVRRRHVGQRPVALDHRLAGGAFGAAVRQGIDRGARHLAVATRIRVQRDEQVGIGGARDAHAGRQVDEAVGIARHDDLIAAGALQRVAQRLGRGQVAVLFQRRAAVRAGVLAAVAGVDDDDLLGMGARRRGLDGGRGLVLRLAADRGQQVGGGVRRRAVGRHQVDDVAIDGNAVGRRQQEAAIDAGGRGIVDAQVDTAGQAFQLPAGNQPLPRPAHRLVELHVRQGDDRAPAVAVARQQLAGGGLIEFDDDPGLGGVAAQAHARHIAGGLVGGKRRLASHGRQTHQSRTRGKTYAPHLTHSSHSFQLSDHYSQLHTPRVLLILSDAL